MTDEQKVFIRGVAGRGNEVLKMLEQRGGKNPGKGGSKPTCIYYIWHNGMISSASIESETAMIIMDNYHEIKLPEQWKDGDVLINLPSNNCFAVCASVFDTRDDAYHCYMFVDEEYDEINTECDYILKSAYRLATPSEIEHFHELMHKYGKDWDAEKKQVVDWKWKPKMADNYWYISAEGQIIRYRWHDSPADKIGFDFGNCFPSREEAESALERVKKALKGI